MFSLFSELIKECHERGYFFERCGNEQGDTLNIFIHGYSAASTESDRDKLKKPCS